MLKKNIETFMGCDADYNNARIVLFGAPFDSTTSFRPGTRFGPSAIRRESYGLELYSPYQDKDKKYTCNGALDKIILHGCCSFSY